MPQKYRCYKCGKEGVAILYPGDRHKVSMVKMTYGKHRGAFKCKDSRACAKRVRAAKKHKK